MTGNELFKGLLNDAGKFKEMLRMRDKSIRYGQSDFLGIPFKYGRYTVTNEQEADAYTTYKRGITRVTSPKLPNCLTREPERHEEDMMIYSAFILDNSNITLKDVEVIQWVSGNIYQGYSMFVSDRLWQEIWKYDAWFDENNNPLIEQRVEELDIVIQNSVYINYLEEHPDAEFTLIELIRLIICAALNNTFRFKIFSMAAGKMSDEEYKKERNDAEHETYDLDWKALQVYVLDNWYNNPQKCIDDLRKNIRVPGITRENQPYKERLLCMHGGFLIKNETLIAEIEQDKTEINEYYIETAFDYFRIVIQGLKRYEDYKDRLNKIKSGDEAMFEAYNVTKTNAETIPVVSFDNASGVVGYNWVVPPISDLYEEFDRINAKDVYKLPYAVPTMYDFEATDGTSWYVVDVQRLEIPEGVHNVELTVRGKLREVALPGSIQKVNFYNPPGYGDYIGILKSELTKLEIAATIPPELTTYAFSPDIEIFVPRGSAQKYKTATNWKEYADNIREIKYEKK